MAHVDDPVTGLPRPARSDHDDGVRGADDDPELPVLVAKFIESVAEFMPPEFGPFVPWAGHLTEVLVRYGQQRWLKWQRSLEAAAEDAGRPVEELLAELQDTPAQQELLSRVLEASGRAIDPGEVRALGLVLSRGLQGDLVDEALMLADALGAVEAPHIQVLGQLRLRERWLRRDLDAVLSGHRLVLPGLLAALSQHGLAETGTVSETSMEAASADFVEVQTWETNWWITPLGEECLALLAAVASQPD